MPTPWTQNVKQVKDNVDQLDATTINGIVGSLVQRDQYLKEQVTAITDKSALVAYSIPTAGTVVGLVEGSLVYYKKETGVSGVDLALASFANNGNNTHFVPADSAFIYGVVKTINTDDTVDVYLQGLITLPNNIVDYLDEESYHELGSPTSVTGPLYLSGKEAGMFTVKPSGSSVYVGFVVSDTEIYLSPTKDSLNSLYYNYQVFLPALVNGTVTYVALTDSYALSAPDFDNPGWVPAADVEGQYGITAPAGAKFFYYVPSDTLLDANTNLTTAEKEQLKLLKEALPPHPSSYALFFFNGVLQCSTQQKSNGNYSVDTMGIWWHNDKKGYQPWKADDEIEYPQMTIWVVKFNPNLQTSVVTSLTTYKDSLNDTSKALVISNPTSPSTPSTGHLQLKLNIGLTEEVTSTPNGEAVSSVAYNPLTGNLDVVKQAAIHTIVGGSGISVSSSDGTATLSLTTSALSGPVLDIEPEECDYVYKGLHSYLRLKNPAINQRVGLVGKVLLPESIPTNKVIRIKLLAFGDSNTSIVPFKFDYSFSYVGGTISDSVYRGKNGQDINVNGLTATTSTVYKDSLGVAYFEVPSTSVDLVRGKVAYFNFRLSRMNNQSAAGNVGILGVFWAIE